tara:strand:- start:8205 stop:11078 length:2874 start_codon:yes stop_codon:yes gene_type:complete
MFLSEIMSQDYRKTIFLPQTDFPMKAQLPKKEPDIIAYWNDLEVYKKLRTSSRGRKKFVLHDGPPYANGHLHIGHALNKILKDVIIRSQQMMGRDAIYVPGWDCHGLPIEWQIEQKYRKSGKDKDSISKVEFRSECRAFAEHWIDIQKKEFQRLGVIGDWDNSYSTMDFKSEAQIVREIGKFLINGGLYRGSKPVMWSPVEKTALAEAEIEYHDHTSTAIWVKFPILNSPINELSDVSILIWTTTPWTIPGNRAIAFGPTLKYSVIEVISAQEGCGGIGGEKIAMAGQLIPQICEEVGIVDYRLLKEDISGSDIMGTICSHPFRGMGYDFDVPLLPGDHVNLDQGSGFVHTAPGHGVEDFEAVIQYNRSQEHLSDSKKLIEIPETVGADGTYFDHIPIFSRKHVYKVNEQVVDVLRDTKSLLYQGEMVHSYPHSWRSKAPLIFRNTPQWFISMDTNNLRKNALEGIDKVRWVPESGKKRIYSMIETRPDWVVSRQRVWGVPITVFLNRETGEPLRDNAVVDRIASAVEEEGAEAWLTRDAKDFLGPEYDPEKFEQVMDILDVWFDSGSSHSFVLEGREDQAWPASLYLEGSDQHRGWFHSSLLESCGTRGQPPYEAVLTHGFVMDGAGKKMSKSLGNVVSPDDVLKKYGADILRLWVVGADYSEDLRISDEILKYQSDSYRRLRNTLRYLLGNLHGFEENEKVNFQDMPELERWVLHRIYKIDQDIRRYTNDFEFHSIFTTLHNFCSTELSAFYFDIRKDTLYCDSKSSIIRRSARTVLDELFNCLTAWLAPILCFTAEEAWSIRYPDRTDSVHFRDFPSIPADWCNENIELRWEKIRQVRRVVTGALEVERAEKRIGSSLEAKAIVWINQEYQDLFSSLKPEEIFITSGTEFQSGNPPTDSFSIDEVPKVSVVIEDSEGEKCVRCWRFMPDTGCVKAHPDLCTRCAEVVMESELNV